LDHSKKQEGGFSFSSLFFFLLFPHATEVPTKKNLLLLFLSHGVREILFLIYERIEEKKKKGGRSPFPPFKILQRKGRQKKESLFFNFLLKLYPYRRPFSKGRKREEGKERSSSSLTPAPVIEKKRSLCRPTLSNRNEDVTKERRRLR